MAKSSPPALRIDLDRARAHWRRQHGLGPHTSAPPLEEVVARHGWVRTLGGIDVYLAVRARVPALRRIDLDRAAADRRLRILPAVRGCIYLVPGRDLPLVMRVAEVHYRRQSDRDREKAGITLAEIDELGAAVVEALHAGPMTTDALRAALPAGSIRKLGPEAKAAGISSPLPIALRYLEFEGRLERTVVGGRLDTERYLWGLPSTNLLEGASVPADPIDRLAAIATRFLEWAGPVTTRDFAAWTAASQKDARAAIDRTGAAPVAIEGLTEEGWVLEAHLPQLREPAIPESGISFLPFEDLYVTTHGGPAVLVDSRHHSRPVGAWGSARPTTLGEAKHVGERPLLVGDRFAGLWEFDPDRGEVVWGTFDRLPAEQRTAIDRDAASLAAFIRDDLGHARSFSLDTDDAIRQRAVTVRELATSHEYDMG